MFTEIWEGNYEDSRDPYSINSVLAVPNPFLVCDGVRGALGKS
jgi:hypothetical protein